MSEPREETVESSESPSTNASGASSRGLRVAAVDIGSNSIRLEVAESLGPDSYRVLTDEKETVGLAATDDENNLEPERVERALEAIVHMVETARGYNSESIHLVATAAVRDAPNRETLLGPIREKTGLDVRILTGDDEARFAHVSVAQAFDLTGVHAAVLDIGGGSTEVAVSASGVIERLFSAPIGAVRLTERFPGAADGDVHAANRMRAYAAERLDKALGRFGIRPGVVFGTGGTFTTLAEIIGNERGGSGKSSSSGGEVRPAPIRGFEIRLAEVAHTLHNLSRMPLAERRKIKGLSAERARIIVAGLAIIDASMRRLGANTLRVHDRGVRDGVLLQLIRDRYEAMGEGASVGGGESGGGRSRLEAVLAFGRRCGFEEPQATHVSLLALELYDQTRDLLSVGGTPPPWATPLNRELLQYAALLRDVGYFINYTKHHKHSFHLIIHSDLPGFSASELERIALLARYHRKAEPKKKHETFGKLDKASRDEVKALAGILRLADGLDRTHLAAIQNVQLTRPGNGGGSGSGGALTLTAVAEREPAPDLWGARRKASLYEAVFGFELRFDWRAPEG